MSKTLLALGTIALLGTLMMVNQPESLDFPSKYQQFKQKYGKRYGQTEDAYRLAVYTQNYLEAEAYNQQAGKTVYSETKFYDITQEEFVQTYLTLKVTEEDLNVKRVSASAANAPAEVDWVKKGAVTPVKDQGQCGSCWAFGTTGVLEGFYFLKNGQLHDLSEQQLVDCSTWLDFNLGCDGGLPARALKYVKRSGITEQSAYPYEAKQNKDCKIKGGSHKIDGIETLAADEETLIAYLAKGPVSVGVDATNWNKYGSGSPKLFDDCGDTLNHAVLAVGYDNESIKIKNSWASDWGHDGYIYLSRGKNTCGVWNTNVVPV